MDESHTLRTGDKAPDSGHTEATVRAVKAAEVAVLLTGTPSLSRPFDLYRQVSTCSQSLHAAFNTAAALFCAFLSYFKRALCFKSDVSSVHE